VSSLDNLRKEAKRWLRALSEQDATARARLEQAYPKAPANPVLRDVQHALARERGFESWVALKASLEQRQDLDARIAATGGRTDEERVATFLSFACWDHHTHGAGDHRMCDRAAARLLAQHPEIARDSIYTAVVCGELAEVERRIAARPEAAREPGGSRGWTPILYLCYTRFSHPSTLANAVTIARLLLDHGANPNDFYMAGDARYSALVGVAGEGEQDSPAQPYKRELFQLLLERGAEPFDIQVLYNTHFNGDVLWWLELVYAHTVGSGHSAEWTGPAWSKFDMGGYGPGGPYLFGIAVKKNDLTLARWLLAHGARPRPDPTYSHPKFNPKMTLYQQARREGFDEMAELLAGAGATVSEPELTDEEIFVRGCFRLDRKEVEAQLAKHPEYLRSSKALIEAARRDRADVIAFLLDLGVPIEVEAPDGDRALHHAAAHNALRAAKLLIERGAEVDPRERAYNGTPIGWAGHSDRPEMLDFLSQYSRNVWTLSFRGYVDRLREVLRDEPDRAKEVASSGETPLWWLPDDEARAMEIVELLLAHGADPAVRNAHGGTAADWALKRGMRDVARRLGVFGRPEQPRAKTSPDLKDYEQVAQNLVFAFETGQPAAMQQLMTHFGGTITWEALRKEIRQRLEALGPDRPDGYFALPHAQLLIARSAGFDSWDALVAAHEPAGSSS
jgi:ankyrin repeat protein